uniref:Homeobox_KN domain-containing protein n=1 Tax=Macrostomum lignano TaxID=282301 RepID=A0A1I8FLR4_9PLAT
VWQQVLQQAATSRTIRSIRAIRCQRLPPTQWQRGFEQQQNPHHQDGNCIASLASATTDTAAAAAASRSTAATTSSPDESALKWRHPAGHAEEARQRPSGQRAVEGVMRQHADNPYPSKREKSALAALTNMSFAQISPGSPTPVEDLRRTPMAVRMAANSAAAVAAAREAPTASQQQKQQQLMRPLLVAGAATA